MLYEPTGDVLLDSRHLMDELVKVGQLTRNLVSKAVVEGQDEVIVDMYDNVVQGITGILLDLQVDLKLLIRPIKD